MQTSVNKDEEDKLNRSLLCLDFISTVFMFSLENCFTVYATSAVVFILELKTTSPPSLSDTRCRPRSWWSVVGDKLPFANTWPVFEAADCIALQSGDGAAEESKG